MKGADLLAEGLESAGVEYAFGLAGSSNLGILDAIARSEIKFVMARHEQVAATMAAGYAMATRTPTVSTSHVGPGAANQIIGIAAADKDNAPVVSITGNEPSYRLGNDVRHEWDIQSIFEKFTKHTVQISHDNPFKQIRNALRRSVTGMPGPVHIDVPRDLEETDLPAPSDAEFDQLRDKSGQTGTTGSRPRSEAINQTIELLQDATQPVVIAGNEFRWFDATSELEKFAEQIRIPVATSKYNRGAISEHHELSIGPVGRSCPKPTNEYVRNADLVVVVGERLSDTTTLNWELIDDETQIVHATLRDRELDRHYLADVIAISDPKSFLGELTTAVNEEGEATFGDIAAEAREKFLQSRKRALETTPQSTTNGVDPRKVVTAIEELAGDFTITTGGGVHTNFPSNLLVDDLNSKIISGDFAGMSLGFPLAMGAQIALDQQVICFEGDGGFSMVMQDLETAVREEIPVKIILFNNHSYMSQRARQKKYYDERYTGSVYSNPPFDEVAELFGMFGECVERDEDVPDAVDRLLAANGPGLLDIHIDPWIGTSDYDRD